MNDFIARYKDELNGVLTGFDRLVFRGNLSLCHEAGMKGYLYANGVKFADYNEHVKEVSERVTAAALEAMYVNGRPVQYLGRGEKQKEQRARDIAANDGITSGPVCGFTAVEPCWSWRVRGNRQTQRKELVRGMRQCLFVYQYWMDAVFGFMSTRLQTWFPFPLYVYTNGRERLALQMNEAGLRYGRHDNCFTCVDDIERAQVLMDEQLKTNWVETLNRCAQRAHPLFGELFAKYPMQYYWTAFQSEWAMDIIFRDAERLRRLYPQLVHLGMTSFSSPDVMRFMDKKVSPNGKIPGSRTHEVVSDVKVRHEGVRIKHRYGKNSVKLYDKAYNDYGAVVRAEITINDAGQFRVYRQKTGEEDGPMAWRPLRGTVADLHRRAEVSDKAVNRYMNAMAQVDDSTALGTLIASVEKPVRMNGRQVRALHPFEADDLALLTAINRGEFAINGLRNRDLQAWLYCTPAASQAEKRQRSAAVSRKLRMLRAHGIIRKQSNTHRYKVSERGRLLLNAVTSAQRATTQQLASLAA